jgi:hypothetical protein
MAQAPNVVKFKRSAVAGKVPATTDLQLGELALNTYDGAIYLKKSVASVESVVGLYSNKLTNGTYSLKLQDNGRVQVPGVITANNDEVTIVTNTGSGDKSWYFLGDGTTQFPGYIFPAADGTAGQILVSDGNGHLVWTTTSATSSGTVTNVSVVTANGFSGEVATSGSTPAITLHTTVTGILKGNADSISAASAGTDYLAPGSLSVNTSTAVEGGSLSYSNGVFTYHPADLTSFVTSSSLSSTLSGYVQSSTLSSYVTSSSLSTTLSGYVQSSTLSSYVTSSSLSSTLSSYVTSSSLSSTLSSYVTSTTLSSYNYISLTALSMDTPGTPSAGGSVTYSSTTGKFKYTPPDLSSYLTSSSSLDATKITGTIPSVVLANSSVYVGTTGIALNRASASQTLNGVSIDGNSATVTNGVYTTGSYSDPAWISSLAYSKLTGAPTSLSSFTNDPGFATTGYVDTAVSGIVGAAPALLNTLNELASALNDDANFATTVASGLNNRVRFDVKNQNKTKTEQENARINIGLDDATIYFLSYMFG